MTGEQTTEPVFKFQVGDIVRRSADGPTAALHKVIGFTERQMYVKEEDFKKAMELGSQGLPVPEYPLHMVNHYFLQCMDMASEEVLEKVPKDPKKS